MKLQTPADIFREKHPDFFALTLEESEGLLRAGRIIDEVLSRYIIVREDGQPAKMLNEQSGAEIIEAFNKKRVPKKFTSKLARRVLEESKWYTLLLSQQATQEQGQLVFSVVRSDGKQGAILPADFPAFYEAKGDRIAEREALGIPADYKFLYSAEWHTLTMLQNIQAERAQVIQSVEFLQSPSAPGLYPPDFIGRAAIASSKEDKLAGIVTFTPWDGQEVVMQIGGGIEVQDIQNGNALKLLYDSTNRMREAAFASNAVDIPLDEYMKLRNLSDTKEAIKQIKKSILILSSLTTTLPIWEKGRQVGFRPAGIFKRGRNGTYYKNNVLHIAFEDDYADHLRQLAPSQYMSIPTQFFKLPPRGSALKFASYMIEQYRINVGKEKRCGRVSVSKLLERSTLPQITEVRKGQEAQKIIRPFTDDLDKLEDFNILSWEFRLRERLGRPTLLSDEELERAYTDYDFFSKLMIHYSLSGEPDYTEIAQRREAHRERLKERAKKQGTVKKRGRPKKQQE